MLWTIVAFACSAAPLPPRPIIAVGDLHADLPAALAVLQLAGAVDAAGHWAAGRAVLVQTGDTTDRGPDSREVIELLMRLEEEAAAAGGQVIALMGNHEAMNLTGDWRYVSPDDIADFGSAQARREALAPTARLGAWLLARDVAVQVDETVFVHGGITAALAPEGVAALSAKTRAALAGQGSPEILGAEGPMWYRGYLLAPEPIACAELQQALTALGARRMVVGHTTQRTGKVAARCGGMLLGIDTGISSYYGSHAAAVRITAGDAVAIYPDEVLDLPDP